MLKFEEESSSDFLSVTVTVLFGEFAVDFLLYFCYFYTSPVKKNKKQFNIITISARCKTVYTWILALSRRDAQGCSFSDTWPDLQVLWMKPWCHSKSHRSLPLIQGTRRAGSSSGKKMKRRRTVPQTPAKNHVAVAPITHKLSKSIPQCNVQPQSAASSHSSGHFGARKPVNFQAASWHW